MRRRAARGNRVGLALLGLALLAAGAALTARSRGWYGGPAATSLYLPAARHYLHAHPWIWPAAAAVAIVVGLACLRWLLVQPRRDLLRRVRLDTDRGTEPGAGRTTLPAAALVDVVEDDLAAQPGIRHASAALTGRPDQPQLWLAVTADARADLGRLLSHLTSDLLPDVRASLSQPDMAVTMRITTTRRQPRPRPTLAKPRRQPPGPADNWPALSDRSDQPA
jgi:hypothetical protein